MLWNCIKFLLLSTENLVYWSILCLIGTFVKLEGLHCTVAIFVTTIIVSILCIWYMNPTLCNLGNNSISTIGDSLGRCKSISVPILYSEHIFTIWQTQIVKNMSTILIRENSWMNNRICTSIYDLPIVFIWMVTCSRNDFSAFPFSRFFLDGRESSCIYT